MDNSDAWGFLFEQIRKSQKSSGLPDVWAWSSSRGPANPGRAQMRRELVAADLEGGKYVTTRSRYTLRRVSKFIPPTSDEMRAAMAARHGDMSPDKLKSQMSCDSGASHLRCRAAFSSGCVPYHGIPIRPPEKKKRNISSPRTLHHRSTEFIDGVPEKYKRWVSSRNPSIEDIPEVHLDEGMAFAAAKERELVRRREEVAAIAAEMQSKPGRRRDDSMAAALQKVVLKQRREFRKRRPKPPIVWLDKDDEYRDEMLHHVVKIQRAFRSKHEKSDPEQKVIKRIAISISEEQLKELKKERKVEKKVPVRWEKLLAMREKRDKSSELPLPGVDEVWDVITRRYGGVRSHATVVDVVDLFHSCKQAGLNMNLAKFPGLWPARNTEPEDVSPAEVAHLCIMIIEDLGEDLTCAQVREEINCVKDECRATEYKDLYIGHAEEHEYINFSHFKRLIHFLSDLMAIDEHYILGTFMYTCTGTFEMADLFAALVMKEMGKKHKWKGKKDSPRADSQDSAPKKKKKEKAKPNVPFEGCAVEDIQNLLNQKFSNVDFSRMCYNCQILDPRNGITFSRCGETFLQTVKHMGKLMKDRVTKRPILHKDEEKWEATLMKYDTPAFLLEGFDQDKNISCCFTIGRSEFCVLVEAFFGILPKTWFGGPLDMCIKLLLKIRARDEDRARPMVRVPSRQSSPQPPPVENEASSGNMQSQSGNQVVSSPKKGARNRSRSPSENSNRSRPGSQASQRTSRSVRSSSPTRPAKTSAIRLEVPEIEQP